MFYINNEDGLIEIIEVDSSTPADIKQYATPQEALEASEGLEEDSDPLAEAVAQAEEEAEAAGIPSSLPARVLYEYKEIWAEEGSSLKSNSAQWSFGNGSTGYIGVPVDAGWQVESIYFMASTYASTAKVQVDLMDYSGPTPGSAASRTITSISLENARDGGGDTDNSYKYETLDTPVDIVGDVVVLGFITREVAGSVGNARVGVRLRREL